jgi:FkbM family methyltransferase
MIRTMVRDTLGKNPRLDGLFRRHIWSRIHFPEAELKLLDALPAGAIDTAIDVGAALGSYAWVLGRKARSVISYEPGEVHGHYMAIATTATNVTLVRAAVGEREGELDMFTQSDDVEGHHTATLSADNPVARAAGVRIRKVPVVALDHDIPPRLAAGAHVDVLKIDVEGFENAVLAGATALIARYHPIVIAEIEARHNPDYAAAFAQLRAAGYTVRFWRDGRYHVLADDHIEPLQRLEDLTLRLEGQHGNYINNFVFQHPASRIKLA